MHHGHLPDGSSVQRHSAGGLYPYVLFAKETPHGLRWGFIDPADGREHLLGHYEAVASHVLHLKEAEERRRLGRPFASNARQLQLVA